MQLFFHYGSTIRGHQITADTIPAHVLISYEFFTPLLKFWVLYTYFPAKNTGSYLHKIPEFRLYLGFAR